MKKALIFAVETRAVISFINYYEKMGSKVSVIDTPFSLESGYSWVRLKTICTKLVDGNHNPPQGLSYKTDFLMLSSQNINDDSIVNLDKVRYLSKEQFLIENKRTNLQNNDILFTSVGTLGRSYIYNGSKNLCFQRSVSVISTLISPEYLKMYLDSPVYQKMVIEQATGTAQKGFYLNQMAYSLIAVPSEKQMDIVVEKTKRIIQLL